MNYVLSSPRKYWMLLPVGRSLLKYCDVIHRCLLKVLNVLYARNGGICSPLSVFVTNNLTFNCKWWISRALHVSFSKFIWNVWNHGFKERRCLKLKSRICLIIFKWILKFEKEKLRACLVWKKLFCAFISFLFLQTFRK